METPKREVRFDLPLEFATLVVLQDREVATMVQVDWKSIYTVRAVPDMSVYTNQDQKCLVKLNNGETLIVLMPYKAMAYLKMKYIEWYEKEKSKYRFYLSAN